MSEFKIEKGVPVPETHAGRPLRFPFPSMDVGDSVVVERKDSRSARSAAVRFGRLHGKRFTARKQPDGSSRIWRVS